MLTCAAFKNTAKQFGSDQAQQNVGPDLDQNCLTLTVILKDFFENFDFEKHQQMKACKITQHAKSKP